jgi:Uma2 family endonuclease
MDDVIEKPMTVEEFDALPESGLPHQYIRGKLILAPPPELPHQDSTGNVYADINFYLRANPGLGKVYISPCEVAFEGPDGPARYQPDVMFFRREHLNRLTRKHAEGAPDLVIEVLSPSTRAYDLNEKRLGYAYLGVPELWIVDPTRREVHVYLLQQDAGRPACTVKSARTLRTELLPGFEFPVSRFFEP